MRKPARCAEQSCGMAGVKTRIAIFIGIRKKMRGTRQHIQTDDHRQQRGQFKRTAPAVLLK